MNHMHACLLVMLCAVSCGADPVWVVERTDDDSLRVSPTQAVNSTQEDRVRIVGATSFCVALQLYERAWNRGMRLVQIDVTSQKYVEATLVSGTRIRISWRQMGFNNEVAIADIDSRLGQLTDILGTGKGQSARVVDLSDNFDGRAPVKNGDGGYGKTSITENVKQVMMSYIAKRGDTIRTVAEAFGVTSAGIMKANRIDAERALVIGERIVIPLDVGKHAAP